MLQRCRLPAGPCVACGAVTATQKRDGDEPSRFAGIVLALPAESTPPLPLRTSLPTWSSPPEAGLLTLICGAQAGRQSVRPVPGVRPAPVLAGTAGRALGSPILGTEELHPPLPFIHRLSSLPGGSTHSGCFRSCRSSCPGLCPRDEESTWPCFSVPCSLSAALAGLPSVRQTKTVRLLGLLACSRCRSPARRGGRQVRAVGGR